MEAHQVDPRFWHQGRKLDDEVERLEDNMRGAIAVRRLELVTCATSVLQSLTT